MPHYALIETLFLIYIIFIATILERPLLLSHLSVFKAVHTHDYILPLKDPLKLDF